MYYNNHNSYSSYQQPHSQLNSHFPVYTSATSRFTQNMNLIVESNEEGGAIYLGNLEAASNVEYLKRHNIGAVLTVAGGTGLRYNPHDIPMHEIIHADDALYQDLSQYFNKIINFISAARKSTNILVHCYAGISRSVTSVVVYLMNLRKWTYERTIAFVRAQRSIANPNPSFVRQLKRFESQLKLYSQNAHNSFNNYSSSATKSPTASRSKQVIDDLFNSPAPQKRAASSYGTRNLYSASTASSQSSQQQQQSPYLSNTPPRSQIGSLYSSTSSLSTSLSYSQQPVSRVLFNQTTNPYSNHHNSSSSLQYAKFSPNNITTPYSTLKNDHSYSRLQLGSSSPYSRPYYSRLVY